MNFKKIRKPLIITLSVILVLNILLQLLCIYFTHTAFRQLPPENAPDSPLFVQERHPPYTGTNRAEILNQKEKDRCYPLLKAASEVVEITSFDGLQLKAYLALKENNHNYAILMHGFKDSPKCVSPYAEHFYKNGFNTLVPGQRGHGWSQGNFIDMSAFTPQDVKSWIEYICKLDSQARIVLWGVSMGGSTVMRATGLDLPENVICCIEDCGFSSAWDEFVYQMNTFYKLPGKLLMPYFNLYIKRKLGFDCRKVSAKDDLKNSSIPTLFIHGQADTYVPYYMLDVVYEAASCPKEALAVEEAQHARAAFTAPLAYWLTVDNFLKKYFF